MRKSAFLLCGAILVLGLAPANARADRDWEYWSRCAVTIPLRSSLVSFVARPEWRFRNDMADAYLAKAEVGVALKVNRFIDVVPLYVWQKSLLPRGQHHSDISYLDAIVKLPLERAGSLKLTERLRHQYNWNTGATTWRNSVRMSRTFKVGKQSLSPYIEDELFYSWRGSEWSENWASVGVVASVGSRVDIGVSFLLDSENGAGTWKHANVLVTSVGFRL